MEAMSRGKALAHKVLLVRFFWPTLNRDVTQLVITYLSYQKHKQLSHHPIDFLKEVMTSCSFDQCVLDFVAPFLTKLSQKRFFLMAMDYFSKWVEAEALA